jgi:hypothetical protein
LAAINEVCVIEEVFDYCRDSSNSVNVIHVIATGWPKDGSNG